MALHIFTHQQLSRVAPLEIDGAMGDFLAGKLSQALRHGGETRHAEQHTAHQRVSHLEVVFVLNVTHQEKALGSDAAFLQQLLILRFLFLFVGLSVQRVGFITQRVGGQRVGFLFCRMYAVVHQIPHVLRLYVHSHQSGYDENDQVSHKYDVSFC